LHTSWIKKCPRPFSKNRVDYIYTYSKKEAVELDRAFIFILRESSLKLLFISIADQCCLTWAKRLDESLKERKDGVRITRNKLS